MKNQIVIIGASARAAAWSMRRAGHTVHAIDLFNDRDLKAFATCQRLPFEEYPQGFLRLLKNAPPGPVMYTGGLENYPDLIEEIAKDREIIGNRGPALRKVRDPFFLYELLNTTDLPALKVLSPLSPDSGERSGGEGDNTPSPPHSNPFPRNGGEGVKPVDWLWKPLRGSAGIGIQRERGPGDGYFQQFCPGGPHSAIFENEKPIGICKQLIGTPWLNAPPFHYAGNIGPVVLPDSIQQTLMRMGEVIRSACDLKGIFGIDFLLYDNQPWLCEVNPRYTASVEVLERAADCGKVVGKAVLYADRELRFPDFELDESFADVPEVGEAIGKGMPICTRFAIGASAITSERYLQYIASAFYDSRQRP